MADVSSILTVPTAEYSVVRAKTVKDMRSSQFNKPLASGSTPSLEAVYCRRLIIVLIGYTQGPINFNWYNYIRVTLFV